jgi:small-conductance mechanosensitive channel
VAFLQLAVLTLLAAVALTAGLEASGLLTPQSNLLANGFINALVPAVLYTAAVYAVCQPGRPDLRLIAVETPAARTLVALMAIAATVYSFGAELTNIATALFIPFSFAVGSSAFTAIVLIVFIALALSVVRREARKNLATENGSYFLTWTLNFVPVLWGLLLIATLALVLGFIALGLFIAGNLLDTIVLAVLLGVIHAFVHALADESGQADRPIGHFLRSSVGWSESTVERFQLLFRTLTDIAVAILALLSLGGLWAVSLLDFTAFLRQAAEGFEIGSIAIHPIAILWAFFVLALGIVLTRYVTSWLQRRVLGATRLDKGAQDSIRTSVGYAGYAVAIAIALSVAGVGFSNLALIAGALGVGIGLGLQAITNNFVSGLILLAERPVRIGDWIVTPAGEGIVRRINVRSTEIETFDNSSIIIPNSNLITNAVRNWTLRDTMGHFNVSVAVAYDANPEAVQKDLATIASSHSMVMRHPPVTVMLVRLTSSAMEFDVSGQVRNVLDAAAVASDVRIEIAKTLGKKLLYIPNKAPAR